MAQEAADGLGRMHIYATPADLPDEYQECATKQESGLTFFHHPFFVSMFPLAMPCTLGDYIAQRIERARHYRSTGRPETYALMHERPYRMGALIECSQDFRAGDNWTLRECCRFWAVAGHIWRDSELPEDAPEWAALLASEVPHRSFLTHGPNRRALAALPDPVPVFRGVQATNALTARYAALKGGFSWSISRDVAAWFSWRWKQGGVAAFVVSATAPRANIIALMTERGESEVLLDPAQRDQLQNIDVTRVTTPPDRY